MEVEVRILAIEDRLSNIEKELVNGKNERPKTIEAVRNDESYDGNTKYTKKIQFFCPGVNSGAYDKKLAVYLWNIVDGGMFKKDVKFCEILLNS